MLNSELVLTSEKLQALRKDLDAIYKRAKEMLGEEDLRQLKKVVLISRVMTVAGLILALGSVNIFAIVLLSLGNFARWTMVAHHVSHRGYDGVPGVPPCYMAKNFAKGWRRFLDWPDWLYPPAWNTEHNVLHHYSLNESQDPDLFIENIPEDIVSQKSRWVRFLYLAFFTLTWKFTYYAPSTWKQYQLRNRKRKGSSQDERLQPSDILSFYGNPVRNYKFYVCSILPCLAGKFILLPLLIYGFAGVAVAQVFLVNLILAEFLTNLHSFAVIVTNHAGPDLYRFEKPAGGKEEFYARQILGSVNFRTGGFWNDFFHGWLNYQIEHHLFPDLSMRQYQLIQPEVKAVCKKHGIPYVQESVFRRVAVLFDIYINNNKSMNEISARPEEKPAL